MRCCISSSFMPTWPYMVALFHGLALLVNFMPTLPYVVIYCSVALKVILCQHDLTRKHSAWCCIISSFMPTQLYMVASFYVLAFLGNFMTTWPYVVAYCTMLHYQKSNSNMTLHGSIISWSCIISILGKHELCGSILHSVALSEFYAKLT